MKFIPDYRVCYKGCFYEADEALEIDLEDVEEMSQHGEILEESELSSEAPEDPVEEPEDPVEDKPRRGRRRKNDEPGEDASADE